MATTTKIKKQIVDGKAVSVTPKTVLVLRTCSAEMKSHEGFTWPESGPVEAKDWSPKPVCGQGLHGWLWGSGDWSLKAKGEGIKWLVCEVEESTLVNLIGKVKFPRANVIGCFGHWREGMALIRARLVKDANAKIESIATEEKEHASATGDSGHASATGYSGHASATGDSGHASATGDSGHASATGDSGHASATGHYGHASATGYSGHASATGHSGHASATGDSGHASATGDYGWAASGYSGRAKAATNGVLTVLWLDQKSVRPRVAVGYVGESGIKADTWYAANDKGELVEVD
jgi:hypothetical protein